MGRSPTQGQGEARAWGRTPQVVAFVAGLTTVSALVVLLALPVWILFRIPGALVAPGSPD